MFETKIRLADNIGEKSPFLAAFFAVLGLLCQAFLPCNAMLGPCNQFTVTDDDDDGFLFGFQSM